MPADFAAASIEASPDAKKPKIFEVQASPDLVPALWAVTAIPSVVPVLIKAVPVPEFIPVVAQPEIMKNVIDTIQIFALKFFIFCPLP